MTDLLFVLAAYLLGSVPFALITSRLFKLADPRSYGSGNPGATNVLRSGNKLAAALTLFGDAFKGWLAVWLAMHFGAAAGTSPWLVAAAGLGVFLGHLYPIFIGFKGGKGVATALGVLLGFSPLTAFGCAACWLATMWLSRYSSAAAIAAAVVAPPLTVWSTGSRSLAAAALAMAILLVWRHRANISRLLRGEESRIGGKRG
ncbi:MAG: glycerol-3-phosphate 1-O-acyltransferase PlsY [Rhodocyclaceae bacterium]|nr:glycerol-3-phosphate 1-O-acyltransferase PlsY [Rhodocyclaceae bacterium]